MGTPAIWQSQNPAGISFQSNTNRWSRLGAGVFFTQAAVATQANLPLRTAGVLSDFWVRCVLNTRDDSAVAFVQINGSDANQTVSIPAATTGIFNDTVNTDAVSGGDIVRVRVNSSHSVSVSTGFELSIIQVIFTATADERVYRLCSAFGGTALSNGFMPCMNGAYIDAGNEDFHEIHVPAGSVRNAYSHVITNIGGTGGSLTLRKNGSDTALVLTIPASTTGVLEETATTITTDDLDTLSWGVIDNATLLNAQSSGIDFLSTLFFGGGAVGSSPITLVGSAVDARKDGFTTHSGNHQAVLPANELFTEAEARVTDQWGGLIVYVSANGQNGTCEWIPRINGSDGNFTVTVPATTTGLFSSTGDGEAVTPTDLIYLRRRANGNNAAALEYHVHNFWISPPAADPGLPPGPPVCPIPETEPII